VRFFLEGFVSFLEGIGDVLQEDQAEDDVLVLGGVHIASELVRRLPEDFLEPDVRAVAVSLIGRVPLSSHKPHLALFPRTLVSPALLFW